MDKLNEYKDKVNKLQETLDTGILNDITVEEINKLIKEYNSLIEWQTRIKRNN